MRLHNAIPCKIDACTNTAWARRMCRKHYYRWSKNGDPQKVANKVPARGEIQRWIHEQVQRHTHTCVEWPFTKNGAGYGLVNIDGKRMLVTRYICGLRNGPPPTLRHQAAHTCGNGHKGCVNQFHLEWKTPSENQSDRLLHGTECRGEDSAVAKLTTKQVLEIRESHGVRNKDLAQKYGVDPSHISAILNRKRWAHV